MFLSFVRTFRPKFFGLSIARDERGAVLVYVTLLLPVFIGLGLLAIDGARLYNLNTHLQKAADALALAGAAELDRKSDAIVRANKAIDTLVSNEQRFASEGATFEVEKPIIFLRKLPEDDKDPILSSDETVNPTQARFVKVTVKKGTLKTVFPASFFGSLNSIPTSATAVAGFDSALCKTVPMFICNPYEGSGDLFTAVENAADRRRQIRLQLGNIGGGDPYFPGNYGWLDTPSLGTGANALRDALAMTEPKSCYLQSGVSQKTGNIESANDAMNVRFNLYEASAKSFKDDARFPPAENVRKGYTVKGGGGSGCRTEPTAPENKLGQDDTWLLAGGRLGEGDWPFTTYWQKNYGTKSHPWGSDTPSRYEVYRHEIKNGLVGDQAVDPLAELETGEPTQCTSATAPATPDRRVLNVAIINCKDLDVRGNTDTPLPVMAFGKFFLTEPVSKDGTIYAELIGLAQPGTVSNDVAHDIVQLYR